MNLASIYCAELWGPGWQSSEVRAVYTEGSQRHLLSLPHVLTDDPTTPRDVLKLGSSRPWQEVLKEMTGQSNISSKSFLSYFKLLLNWLVNENVKQDILGWPDYSCSFEGWTKPTLALVLMQLEALPLPCSGSILNSSQFMAWHGPAQ